MAKIAIVAATAAFVASVILLRGLDERLARTPVLSPMKGISFSGCPRGASDQ